MDAAPLSDPVTAH